MSKHFFVLSLFLITLGACSSQPVIPTTKDISVSREKPTGNCENLGTLTGKSMHDTGGKEAAIEDLKEQAANKGATDIEIHQFSDMGTAVTGTLYLCQ